MAAMNSGLGGPAGYGENVFSTSTKAEGNNDDGAVEVDVSSVFGSGMNVFGTTYSSLFINSNGSITFGAAEPNYWETISSADNPKFAAFLSDVDLSNGGEIYWDLDPGNGKVTITWSNVAPWDGTGGNSFQIVLTDTGSGDFDVEYIYADIQWTDGSSGDATVGIADGNGLVVQQEGSGDAATLTSYPTYDFGSGSPGSSTISFVGGQLPPMDPANNDTLGLGDFDASGNEITTGDDLIEGGIGNDVIDGSGGADTILGGGDADTFVLRDNFGNDTITGGETGIDQDTIDASDLTSGVGVTLNGTGSGTLTDGTDTLGFSEIEGFELTGSNDTVDASGDFSGLAIVGGAGNDSILGGSGADTITGGTGLPYGGVPGGSGTTISDSDFLFGTTGADEFIWTSAGGDADIALNANGNPASVGDGQGDKIFVTDSPDYGTLRVFQFDPGLDQVVLPEEPDSFNLTFSNNGNSIFEVVVDGSVRGTFQFTHDEGTEITDPWQFFSILGSATDNDTINGGAGSDSIEGGAGNDILDGGSGSDTVDGGDGNDSITGGPANNGFDVLRGGAGNDTLRYSDLDTVYGGADDDRISALGGSEDNVVIYGDGGNDSISGANQRQAIYGGDGNDTITGGNDYGTPDRDTLDGGAGNDSILSQENVVGHVNGDLLFGGAGNDTLVGGAANDVLDGGDDADTLLGGAGDDSISGGEGDDFLKSGRGQDTLDGGDGADTLMNAAGDDSLVGGAGDDLIVATQGQDTLEGGTGDDTLMGGVDGDSVDGGADDDLILGDLAGVAFNESGTDGVGVAANLTDFPQTQLTLEITFASETLNGITPLASYAVSGSDSNEFLMSVRSDGELEFWIDNFDVTVGNVGALFDGNVQSIAVSWDSATGALEVYTNGTSFYSGTFVPGATLTQGGTLTLGQEQDEVGGGFDANQIFEGTIYGVRLYDDVRTSAEILDSTHGPVADTSDPNLIANWVADPDGPGFTDQTGNHPMTLSGDVAQDWSAGADTLLGGSGEDTIYAGGGDDSIDGGGGLDSILGGSGDDTIDGGGNTDTIFGGAGDDLIFDTGGSASDDTIYGEAGDDTIDGGVREDYLDGGDDADTFLIEDGDGNDTIIGGEGTTTGTDFDVIDLSGVTTQGITLTYLEDEAGTIVVGADTITFSEIEQIILTEQGDNIDAQDLSLTSGIDVDAADGNDTVVGSDFGDTIAGGDGDDFIEGGEGNDLLTTGLGDDTLMGGEGDDTLMNSDGDDSLDGGAGDDSIVATGGEDTLRGGAGDDTMQGGADADTFIIEDGFGNDVIVGGETTTDGTDSDSDVIDLSALSGPVTVTYTGDEAGTITDGTDTITFSEVEKIILTDQADVVDGTADSAGLDIEAGGGNDTITGGSGDDVLRGNAGDDTIFGGDGNDTIAVGSALGGTGDLATGENYVDAGDGDDSVLGSQGADTVLGGAGSDTIQTSQGDDSINGGTGDDSVFAGQGADTVLGGDGNDTLKGGAGDDTIDGGDGDDIIEGGDGNDLLTGGDGDDTYVFNPADGDDTITDFNTGNSGALGDGDTTNNDFIDLSQYYTNMSELRADFDDDGILNQSTGDYSDNSSMDGGSVTFQSADRSSFTADNTGVVCFDAGTMILAERGEVPVEQLRPGDRIQTMDNGLQPLAMLAARRLGPAELDRHPELKPIEFKPGALGEERAVIVSPQHAMLIRFEGEERLVRARQLARVNGGAVRVMRGRQQVTYFHLIFEAHQIIFANNRPSESFFPGPRALAALSSEARLEFDRLFPELSSEGVHQSSVLQYGPARIAVKSKHLPCALSDLQHARRASPLRRT